MLFRLDLPYPPQTRQQIVICRTKRVVRIYKRIRRKVWETSYGHLIFRRAPREGHTKKSPNMSCSAKNSKMGGESSRFDIGEMETMGCRGFLFFSAELCVSERRRLHPLFLAQMDRCAFLSYLDALCERKTSAFVRIPQQQLLEIKAPLGPTLDRKKRHTIRELEDEKWRVKCSPPFFSELVSNPPPSPSMHYIQRR